LIHRELGSSLRKASACGEVKAMNAYVASFDIAIAAIPAGAIAAVNGLNNNANNNTRHYGWAGV
jgi:hydrogenase/urease accessory protein HupE